MVVAGTLCAANIGRGEALDGRKAIKYAAAISAAHIKAYHPIILPSQEYLQALH